MGITNILAASKRLGFVMGALAKVGITEEHVEQAAAGELHDFIAARVTDADAVSKLSADHKAAVAERDTHATAMAGIEAAVRSSLNITSGGPLDENVIAASVEVLVKDRASKLAAENIASRGFKPQAGANETGVKDDRIKGGTPDFIQQNANRLKAQLGLESQAN